MPVVTTVVNNTNITMFNTTKCKEIRFHHLDMFSDGAESVQILDMPDAGDTITVRIGAPKVKEDTMKVAMRLALIFDAFVQKDQNLNLNTNVYLEYVPFARADRAFAEGMPIPLRAFIDLVKVIVRPSLNWKLLEFITLDVHNKKAFETFSGFTKVNNIKDYQLFSLVIEAFQNTAYKTVFVAPDKGAVNRTQAMANSLKVQEIVTATKERDPLTGKITNTVFDRPDLVAGKQVIIVDDICDGGGTFIPLANALYAAGAAKVVLAVTHLIASKGLKPLLDAKIEILYAQQACNYF